MSTTTEVNSRTELIVNSDFRETSGLTVRHLREFVEGANQAGLADNTAVELVQKPQSDIRIIDVQIRAVQVENQAVDTEAVEA